MVLGDLLCELIVLILDGLLHNVVDCQELAVGILRYRHSTQIISHQFINIEQAIGILCTVLSSKCLREDNLLALFGYIMVIEPIPHISRSVKYECIVMAAVRKPLMDDDGMQEVGMFLLAVHKYAFNLVVQVNELLLQLAHLLLHELLIALQYLDSNIDLSRVVAQGTNAQRIEYCQPLLSHLIHLLLLGHFLV